MSTHEACCLAHLACFVGNPDMNYMYINDRLLCSLSLCLFVSLCLSLSLSLSLSPSLSVFLPFSPLPRIYIYDEVLKSFTLLEVIDHHHHCILTVSNIILSFTDSACKTASLLLSAATDGSIVLWPLSSIISKWFDDQEKGREEEATPALVPLLSIDQAHQSGINDISVILIQESPDSNLLLIASVGDDTSLVISLCSVSCDSHLIIKGQCKMSSAHYSAITGKCNTIYPFLL